MSHLRSALLALVFVPAAFSTAQAAYPTGSAGSPYSVELVGADDVSLPTYRHRGRYYTLGDAGQRYRVRVHNPTDRRVEAVISVDGLDAIDGRPADFVGKRGYVVPPYGTVTVDGFRVSMNDVATFRFSSVGDSYAGRKGNARHVGVVGVALFAECEVPRVYMVPPSRQLGDDEERGGDGRGRGLRSEASQAPSARDRPRARPGLGTEFGERRHAPVNHTSFTRAHPTRPTAMAEIRYNDRDGLMALGIRIEPWVPEDEAYLRETADPFPHSPYATPPSGWNR